MQTEPPPCAETAMQTAPKEEGIATQTEIALEEVAVQTEIIRHVEAAVAGVLSKVDLLHFLPEIADSKSGAWQVVDPLTLREAPGKIHAALDAAVPDGQDLHILDENELVTGELLRIHDITGQLLWQSGRLGEEPPKKIVEACKATEIVVVFEDNFEDLDEGGELKCIAGLTDKDHLLQFLPAAADSSGVWFPLEPFDLEAAPRQCHKALHSSTPHGEELSILEKFKHVHGQLLRLHDQRGNLLWQSSQRSKSSGSGRSPSQALKDAKGDKFVAVLQDTAEEDAEQLIAGSIKVADLLRFLPTSPDPGNVWHFTEPVHLGEPPEASHKDLERSKLPGRELHILQDEEYLNGHVLRILDSNGGMLWRSDSGGNPVKSIDALDGQEEVAVVMEEWLPDDEPGKYRIIGNGGSTVGDSLITEGQNLVGRLEKGAIVNVLEVRAVPKEKRIRGRIEKPPGWISLENTETKFRWAVPSHKRK